MADDDHVALTRERHEGVAQRLLGLPVEAGRGLVEQQDRGLPHEGPRDGEELAQAAREAPPRFADLGAVAVGQVDDVLVHAGEARRGHHRLVRRRRAGLGDILAHAAREQEQLLRHVADPSRDLGARELAHVGAIEQDTAGIGRIEALHELEQGGLAAAVGADDGVQAGRVDVEVDVVDDRLGAALGLIGEAHPLDRQATRGPLERHRVALALDGGREGDAQARRRLPAE